MAEPRFANGDIVILDTSQHKYAGRTWRVKAVLADEYLLQPEDGHGNPLRVPSSMAIGQGDTPKASTWLENGTLVRYDGSKGFPDANLPTGGFGVVTADKANQQGELIANVSALGGSNRGYIRVPHRDLTVVPVTDTIRAALLQSASEQKR